MTSVRLLTLFALTIAYVASAQYGAMPVAEGLSPRYYLAGSAQLSERQSGDCPASDQHTCLDVGFPTHCCSNINYCIVLGNSTTNLQPGCCFIGSTCSNPCGPDTFQCIKNITVSGVAAATTSCCPRACPSTSAYKCASAYGGACCSYGYTCASSGQCRSTVATSKAVATPVPSGCTTNQNACPTSLGGGCCDNTLACTVVDNTNFCALNTALATRTGTNGILATAVTKHSDGLSTGAKAGIGAGIAVAACVILGCLTWFCITKRRSAKESQRASQPTSEGSAQGSKRPSQGRQASDYFGPTAAAGPFTEQHTSAATSPGVNRGVPASPHSPGDIAAPVEIDSRSHSNVTSPGVFVDMKSPSATVAPVELP